MITQRRPHSDQPNEIATFFTEDEMACVDDTIAERGLAANLSELRPAEQRAYCDYLYHLDQGTGEEHLVATLEGDKDNVHLSSRDLGSELVSAFMPPETDEFDPTYRSVNFTFHVLDGEGEKALEAFAASPSEHSDARAESVLKAARFVVAFSITPPNLAA